MVMVLYLVTRRVSFHFKAIGRKQKSGGKNPLYDITEERVVKNTQGRSREAAKPRAQARRRAGRGGQLPGGSLRPGGPGRDGDWDGDWDGGVPPRTCGGAGPQ